MVKLVKPRVSVIAPRIHVDLGGADGGVSRYGSGRGGRPWRRIRDRILERDGHLCQECKRGGDLTLATEVDHILATAFGGDDDDANLEAICHPHQEAKRQREAAEGKRRAIGGVGRKLRPSSADT